MAGAHYPGEVYLLNLPGTDYYKIGLSIDAVNRSKKLSAALPADLDVAHVIYVADCQNVEDYFHGRYKKWQTRNEWFGFSEDLIKILTAEMDECAIERPKAKPESAPALPQKGQPFPAQGTEEERLEWLLSNLNVAGFLKDLRKGMERDLAEGR
jgi:hypothetical protein